ncbi:MAG: hypothetical protein Kow0031_21060 [Anaerolineae bacterium]
MTKKRRNPSGQLNWFRADLHLHTPASQDYQQPGISYLDILQTAESRGLDIIAFTDHNTANGIKRLRQEVEELELLAQLKRIHPDEQKRLDEFHRLLDKILLLPGFELTATLGFHILGIFPPETTLRELELILLNLRVPATQLDAGATQVGATVDVLTAYRVINEAGGLAIAAHANSSHGVAMQGFNFGGQTKIAYTQDPNLHALEVTDLESRRRRTTANFFNGSKPEYPRRMHCIQGSDAHRLTTDPADKTRLGIGDRVTELNLPQRTFAALKELFLSNDFSRTRPFRATQAPFDHIVEARKEGTNIVQAFHPSMTQRGGHLYAILTDICAFANTNGGAIFVGVSEDPKAQVSGVSKPSEAIKIIRNEVEKKVNPPLDIEIDVQQTQDKKVLQITVPVGDDPPYVIDDYKIYVRDETDTNLAVRDEIVALVKRSLLTRGELEPSPPAAGNDLPAPDSPAPDVAPAPANLLEQPKTGVEIIGIENRKGKQFYSLRDLRNGNVVHNVTRQSARKLWQYALNQHETNAVDPAKVDWQGDIGLWKKHKRAGQVRYDLVQRDSGNGQRLHVYYGVTENGLHGPWQKLCGATEETDEG